MPDDKGLNRGGSKGQEGELSPDGGSPEAGIDRSMDLERKQQQDQKQQGNPGKRDQQKQGGGVGREPNLEEKHKIQPTHEVD